MLKGYNPASVMRCKFLRMCFDKEISYPTIAKLTECMNGKPYEEKEKLAEQLLTIISKSKNEKEMVEEAKKLR